MRHLKEFKEWELSSNGPAISLRSISKGDKVYADGKEYEFVECRSWVKDKNANCLEFSARLGSEKVIFKWDDGIDGYKIV
jgi:hypothetical protein